MIIIGTAGHIDHGKTSLIKSLTGIETDRLTQEKERGISIELGFAYMDLPDGGRCGIIDVPGHERFVKQMIAGATGVDLVVLVIAADEGVMQQTREHLDICRLLGIQRGTVVITKIDLVDEEWLELVESDIEDFVAGTFLDGAPVHHFSTQIPETRTRLIEFITSIVKEVDSSRSESAAEQPLRLPVDRVFTMKGFGTVITGTVGSGTLNDSDKVVVVPGNLPTKVRGIQSHNEAVKWVSVGQRAAVNLIGIETEALSRGQVLTHPNELAASRMLDIDLHLLHHVPKPLPTQAKALVHVGTSQVTGTVVLLDRKELLPGEECPAQLRLDEYVVALGDDHVVLRGFELLESYGKTLGGGVIRHPTPTRHKAHRAPVLDALSDLRSDNLQKRVEAAIRMAGQAGAALAEIRQVVNCSLTVAEATANELTRDERAYRYVEDGLPRYVHVAPFTELLDKAREVLADHHTRFAHRPGIPRQELRSRTRADLPPRFFNALVEVLVGRNELEAVEANYRRPGFVPTLTAAQTQLKDDLFTRLHRGRLEPPLISDVCTDVGAFAGSTANEVREMLDLLVADGQVVRASDRLAFATDHIERLQQDVVDFLKKRGEMSTPELKTLTGTSRKYTVPLGEYLDARKITILAGDVRRLRS